jgi:hypothetical protein
MWLLSERPLEWCSTRLFRTSRSQNLLDSGLFELNLAQFKPAAQMRLSQQPQRSPATSLDEVLAKLKLTAHEDTKSNDFIQDYDFAANLRTDVVLLDRKDRQYIVLHCIVRPVNS